MDRIHFMHVLEISNVIYYSNISFTIVAPIGLYRGYHMKGYKEYGVRGDVF